MASTAHSGVEASTTFFTEGKDLLAGITEATEDAQRMQNDLNIAGLLAKVPALTGLKPTASAAEREQAKYDAFAKIQIGREFGLKPAESLREVYFDQNGAGIGIHARVGKALATGRHRFEIRHLNETGGEIQWFVKRDGQWQACTPIKTTVDQLKHIQIWEYDRRQEKSVQKPLTEKWNYKSWKEDMIYGFIQRRNIRRYAPETQGSYPIAAAEEADMEDAGLRENGHVPSDADMGWKDAPSRMVEALPRQAVLENVTATAPPDEESKAAMQRGISAMRTTHGWSLQQFGVWLKTHTGHDVMGPLDFARLCRVSAHLHTHGANALNYALLTEDELADQVPNAGSDPEDPDWREAYWRGQGQASLPDTEAGEAETKAGGLC